MGKRGFKKKLKQKSIFSDWAPARVWRVSIYWSRCWLVESEIRNVEFGWKIEFLFLVLGGSVIPGHCGEKTDSDDLRLIVCKWTKHPPCHRLAHIWVRCNWTMKPKERSSSSTCEELDTRLILCKWSMSLEQEQKSLSPQVSPISRKLAQFLEMLPDF